MTVVRYNTDQTEPELVLHLPASMAGTVAEGTVVDLATIFNEALLLAAGKEVNYGGAWKAQGWMGNFARLQSKMSRLRNMIWRDHPIEDAEETTVDTALDFINLSAFFVINRRDDSRWGS